MKKTIVMYMLALTTCANAQIKIFPGGLQSYGSTTSPASGEKHRFSGSVVIGQTPTSSAAAYIRGNNTTSIASSPDYTWLGNDQTGIFHPGSNIIGFTIGGGEAFRISANKNLLIGTTTDDNNQRCVISGATDKTVLNLFASHTTDYNYGFACNVNRTNAKAIAVGYNGTETFKVMGGGQVYSLGYYIISDRNLKENFDTISGALGKLLQLNGVTYNYKAQQLKPNAMAGTVLPSVAPKKEIGLVPKM